MLLVIAGSIGISASLGAADAGVQVVGAIPAGLPHFAIPELRWHIVVDLLPTAFVIALVGFMEVASNAKLISARTHQPWNENQELIGQGMAKVAAAISGTQPVSASFSAPRSIFGRRPYRAVFGVYRALRSIDAAVLHTDAVAPAGRRACRGHHAGGRGLLDFGALKRAWRASRDDGIAAAATFVATLLFAPNIQNGIPPACCCRSRSTSTATCARASPCSAARGRHLSRRAALRLAHPHPGLVILRFDGALHFINAASFEDAVLRVAISHPEVKIVLISGAGINSIDASGLEFWTGCSIAPAPTA